MRGRRCKQDDEDVAEKDVDLKYPLGSMAEYHQQADADLDKRRLTKQLKFQEMMKIKQRDTHSLTRRNSEDGINTAVSECIYTCFL